jgi:hypothetical protein
VYPTELVRHVGFRSYFNGVKKVLLFNPRSGEHKHRIPNSVLQVAASIEGLCECLIVDGNRETGPWKVLSDYLKTG